MEHAICGSSLWRYLTERQLLPWVLSGVRLGDHVLEIGAGYGAATPRLREMVPRVTSLEYDAGLVERMKGRLNGGAGDILQGDGANLPFAGGSFSSVVAILVLHHLKTRELQDQMFGEAYRVLRPGGEFIAFEIADSWWHRVGHFRSTFTPLTPGGAFGRLSAAGFERVAVDFRRGGFRVSAVRARE